MSLRLPRSQYRRLFRVTLPSFGLVFREEADENLVVWRSSGLPQRKGLIRKLQKAQCRTFPGLSEGRSHSKERKLLVPGGTYCSSSIPGALNVQSCLLSIGKAFLCSIQGVPFQAVNTELEGARFNAAL